MDFNYDTGTIDTVSILDTTEASPLLAGVTGVLYVLGTGAISLPYGSTGQQPSPAIGGMLRYNTGGYLEYYNSTIPAWVSLSTGGGSVTSITVTTDSPALQVSGGASQTITTSGTFALQLASTLDSLGNLASNGIVVNNGGTISAVTIQGTAGNITVTNGSGTAGNPTINLATVTQGSTGTSFVKVNIDGFGRVIDNTAVTQSDITTVVGTYYLPESGGTMSGAINMGGNQINNLAMAATPAATDATTVAYVQSLISGLSWKEAVAAATTAPLPSVTYNNGSSGVGATLTDTSTGTVLVIDGYTVQLNDRVLIKNQANPIQNGIYYLSTVGVAGTTPFVLTRTTDTNTGTELFGAAVYVDQGTTNANTGWTQTTTGTIVIGSSNIVWSQFSGSGTYTAGTGISIVGNTISNTGVLSFQTSLNGLTPSTATNGVVTLAGTLGISSGGTGQTTAQTAFDALSPLTTTGDTIYYNGTHNVRLPVGTSGQILYVNTNVPAWETLSSVAVTSIAGTANEITASAATGAVTLSIPNTFIAPGSVQVTTTLQTSATNSITAAGTSQGTATALTTDYNVVTTVAAGAGVKLPASLAGNLITVVNQGANPLLVYPASGVSIDGLASNSPVTVPVGQTYTVEGTTSTQMYTVQPTFAAGTGIGLTDANGVVTYSNTGVTSITGTANQITASASTGAVTLSLPSSVSINSLTLTGLTANSFIYSGTGGTITSTSAPTNGELLIGSTGAAPVAATLTQGTGITITNGAGSITVTNSGVTSLLAGTGINVSSATGAVTVSNTGVLSFSAGTTGFTPSTATTGAVTLAGTLNVANGGTGDTSFTANGVLYGAGAGALGVTAAGTTGQILVGNTGTAPTWANLSSTVVTSFQTSLSGLTPSTASTGAVTLAGTLNSTSGGTGTSTAPTAGQVLVGTTGGQYVPFTITTGTGISTTTGSGTLQINNTGVTSAVAGTGISVSAATGAVTFSNTGVLSVSLNDSSTTPIYTTSPTAATTGAVAETITLINQSANTGFFGPTTGAAAQPTFRNLVYADVVGHALKLYAENPSSPVAPSATGTNAIALGSAAVSSQYGGVEQASGEFAAAGDAQHGTFTLRNQTTNATQTPLYLDGSATEFVVPANSVVTFSFYVAAINTAVNGKGAGWKYEGVVYRGATVGTTAFIGTPAETTLGRSSGFNPTIAVNANASTGALELLVTGIASTTINWVATLETTEVGAS